MDVEEKFPFQKMRNSFFLLQWHKNDRSKISREYKSKYNTFTIVTYI